VSKHDGDYLDDFEGGYDPGYGRHPDDPNRWMRYGAAIFLAAALLLLAYNLIY
jgi:hypothetical protein